MWFLTAKHTEIAIFKAETLLSVKELKHTTIKILKEKNARLETKFTGFKPVQRIGFLAGISPCQSNCFCCNEWLNITAGHTEECAVEIKQRKTQIDNFKANALAVYAVKDKSNEIKESLINDGRNTLGKSCIKFIPDVGFYHRKEKKSSYAKFH